MQSVDWTFGRKVTSEDIERGTPELVEKSQGELKVASTGDDIGLRNTEMLKLDFAHNYRDLLAHTVPQDYVGVQVPGLTDSVSQLIEHTDLIGKFELEVFEQVRCAEGWVIGFERQVTGQRGLLADMANEEV